MADNKSVTVFDPEREALVDVPNGDVAALAAAGYKTGQEAQEAAIYKEAPAKAAALLGGAANTASLGLSDTVLETLLPQNMLEAYHNSVRANPDKREIGGLFGLPANMAVKGVATAVGGTPGLAAVSGLEGAAEAFGEEKRLGEPISIERLLQAAGLNALLNVGGEYAARGISAALPAGAKALRGIAKRLQGAGVPEFPDMPFSGSGESPVPGIFPEQPPALPGKSYPVDPSLPNLAGEVMGPPALPTPPETFARPRSAIGAKQVSPAIDPGYTDLAELIPGGRMAARAARYASDPGAAAAFAGKAAGAAERIARVTQPVANALSKVLKGLVFAGSDEAARQLASAPLGDIDEDYQQKTQAVENAVTAPDAVAAYMQEMYGPAFAHNEHLRVAFDTMQTQALANATLLHDHMPRAPFDPALQGNDWNPPRSAKIDWLRKYRHIDDPVSAFANPTPANIALVEQTHPATVQYARDVLLSMLQDPKTFPLGKRALTTEQARKISIVLGTPVRPQTDGKYIARLQKSAVPDAPQSVKPKGAPSAKAANQVILMSATPMQQHELGQ